MAQTTINLTMVNSGVYTRYYEASWNAVHDADVCHVITLNNYMQAILSTFSGTFDFWIKRGRLVFNTSPLTEAAIIDKVVFRIMFNALQVHYGTSYICLVSGEGLGDVAEVEDYGVIRGNTTLISPQVNSEDFVVDEFRDFELDPAYHNLVNKTGNTILCLRTSFDREDDPVINNVKELQAQFYFGQATMPEPPEHRARLIIDYHMPVPPTVTTDPATGISVVSATPNGTLDDDGGLDCDCGFEWGPDTGYGNTTPPQSKNTGETFSQVIHGLSPYTTYHFRALATNQKGTSYGSDRSFITSPAISKAYALAREEL